VTGARRLAAGGLLLGSVVSAPVGASEPCPLAPGSDHTVAIRLTAPTGAVVAGVTLVVDHPQEAVGLAGAGVDVKQSAVISHKPPDAIASANDLGEAVRVVIARPGELPLHGPLLRLHFQRCEGVKPPDPAAFSCTVRDAADPATNAITGLTCAVVPP
jgi:hypothetical protein